MQTGSRIASDTLRLFSSGLWTRVLGFISGIVAAGALGPAGFGLLKLITLVPTLAKYGSLGFDSVVQREVPHIRVAGSEPDEESRLRNVAFTADLLWSAVLGLGVVAYSFTHERPEVRYGLWMAASALVLTQVLRLHTVTATVDRKFGSIARSAAFGVTADAAIVIGTVAWAGIFSVLAGSIVGLLVTIVSLRRENRLGIQPSLERGELRRQVRIAVPMAASTISFGAFLWVERGTVATVHGTELLGIYMLVMAVFELGYMVTQHLLRASVVDLYERLAARGPSDVTELLTVPTLALSLAFALLGGVAYLMGDSLLALVLPQYREAVPLLAWIGALLVLRVLTAIPITAMNSRTLDMQTRAAVLWIGASVIFAIVAFGSARAGLGIAGAVIAKVVALAALAGYSLWVTKRYFFVTGREFVRFLSEALAPVVIAAVIMFGVKALPDPGANEFLGDLLDTVVFSALFLTSALLLFSVGSLGESFRRRGWTLGALWRSRGVR